MSFEIHNNYSLMRAIPEMATDITRVVNQAYGAQFNRYLLNTPDHPIERTTEKIVQSYIEDPSMELYVLVNKTTRAVAGTICYIPNIRAKDPTLGYCGFFSLVPEAQGTDLGKLMGVQIERIARAQGKTRMEIDVSGFAVNLQAHYQKHGYQPTGRTIAFESNIHWKLKKELKNDPRSKFVVLEKNLEPAAKL